jgi:hypothetical protein
MRPLIATAIAVAVLLAACGGRAAPRASSPHARPPLDPTPSRRLPNRHFVAGCDDPRVTGGLPNDYRRESITAGPLAIYPARSEFPHLPRDDFVPVTRPARYAAVEAAMTVLPGADVTVAVGAGARSTVAFLFDSARFGDANRGYTVREGDRAVTFHGCFKPYTQYQGGFVVTRPQCAHLTVRGRGLRPVETIVSFGAGAC